MFKTLISAAKAMVSVVAIVLAFTLNASAQDRAADAAKKSTDNLKTELSLSDAQYGKVLEINKTFADKTAEVRKTSTDKKETAQAVKALNEERESSLKGVLTDEQYKTYLEKKEERKNAALKRFNGGNAEMKANSGKMNVTPAPATPEKQ